jgi:hypothetical protein
LFLGDQLMQYIVLALGGAMVLGTGLALVKPRPETKEGELDRPPLGRSLVFMAIGLVAAVWALATLVHG